MMSFPASSNGEKQTRKSSLPKKMVATGKELLTVNEELISASDKKKISELRVPVPKREYERLTILRQCNLLDTAADQAYDRFSALCARYFKTPIVVISLVDANRQWFKSRIGLASEQTPRDIAFCAYTILEETPRVMVVPDAREDARFKTNPLVLGFPFIRFYGGASIIIEGVKVGTLCLIDSQPHAGMAQEQQEILIDIADCVAGLMTDRRASQFEHQFNSIHMHQSVLSILREPLRQMKTSADEVGEALKTLKTCTSPVNVRMTASSVIAFQNDASYFQNLLDSSLRSLVRVMVNPETEETMNMVDWKERKRRQHVVTDHRLLHPPLGDHLDAKLGTLLPFEKAQWHKAVCKILEHNHHSNTILQYDIDETVVVQSHTDLLLLCVTSLLYSLSSLRSPSHIPSTTTAALDVLESIHTYLDVNRQVIVIEILSTSSSDKRQQQSSLLHQSPEQQDCAFSIVDAVRTVLSWVDGKLLLSSQQHSCTMCLEVDCEILSTDTLRPTTVKDVADAADHEPTTSTETGSDELDASLSIPVRAKTKSCDRVVDPHTHPGAHTHQLQKQQQQQQGNIFVSFAHNFWQSLLSRPASPFSSNATRPTTVYVEV